MADTPQESGLPDVQLKIGGENYTIKFGLRAILALKDKWKLANQREVQAHIAKNSQDLEVMVDVVWASLQTYHRDLTPDDALDLLDKGDMAEIAETLTRAMENASPPAGPQAGQGRAKRTP